MTAEHLLSRHLLNETLPEHTRGGHVGGREADIARRIGGQLAVVHRITSLSDGTWG